MRLHHTCATTVPCGVGCTLTRPHVHTSACAHQQLRVGEDVCSCGLHVWAVGCGLHVPLVRTSFRVSLSPFGSPGPGRKPPADSTAFDGPAGAPLSLTTYVLARVTGVPACVPGRILFRTYTHFLPRCAALYHTACALEHGSTCRAAAAVVFMGYAQARPSCHPRHTPLVYTTM